VATTALIGTTLTGLLYLSSPFLFTLLTRYPRLRVWSGPFGLVVICSSLLASSFTTSIPAIVATQGVLQALGAAFLYAPTTLHLDEWFAARRGLAYGIMGASKSAAGVVLPLVTEPALERFGSATVVRAWAVGAVLLTAPLLHFVRPRIPHARPGAPSATRRLSLRFARYPAFWVHALGNVLQSLGYFLPTAYLPGYAANLGLSGTVATVLLAVLNGLAIVGSATFGVLADRLGPGRSVFWSTVGSAVSVLLFWGLASHVAMLAVFAMLYGFFAGGFSSTWSSVLTELKRECPEVDTGFVYGLMAGGRGIGNVISGPLSVSLMQAGMGKAAGGYGSRYGSLILFTGASAVLGGLGSTYRLI
jgi:MFS family permease